MPITYYTDAEFLHVEKKLQQDINRLICEVKKLRNEPCNINNVNGRVVCCGTCEFRGWGQIGSPVCTHTDKYFSK